MYQDTGIPLIMTVRITTGISTVMRRMAMVSFSMIMAVTMMVLGKITSSKETAGFTSIMICITAGPGLITE